MTDVQRPSLNNLKVLTLNTGLLKLNYLFGSWECTPYVKERRKYIAAALKEHQPDIIALQEIYKLRHQKELLAQLREEYPYSYADKTSRALWGFSTNGLMILSKYPITESSSEYYTDVPLLEKLLVRKGYIESRVVLPGGKDVHIVNTHITTGVIKKPQSKVVRAFRTSENRELESFIKARQGIPSIITGDFNCSPSKVSIENFKDLLDNDWTSTYDSYHLNDTQALDEDTHATWSITNPLNIHSTYDHSPSQRIDHIFLSRYASDTFNVAGSEIVFTSPAVSLPETDDEVNNVTKVTVSDHFGLLTTLTFK